MTDSSWLKKYIDHTRGQESPITFHIWTGLSILAAAMGRKVWLARRSGGVTRYTVYPGQLMVVLTAGSGVVRKSTAAIPATKLVKFINKPIISGKSSVEAFLKQMDGQAGGSPQAILVESELTNFISKASYLDPLIEVFIKLHDAEDEFVYNTIAHGKIVIKEPCLTLLSCTTPESLGNRLPNSAHGSGFLSRVLFVFANETDRLEDLSDVEDDDLDLDAKKAVEENERLLKAELSKINSMAGPMTFTKEGREWFRKFYKGWVQSPAGKGEGYPTRKPDHLLRVAMCFAASDSQKMSLEPSHLQAAKKVLDLAEKDFDKVFMYVGTNFVKDRQRILDFLAVKAGQATTGEICATLHPFFKDLDTLKRTLMFLAEGGLIREKIDASKQPSVQSWSLCSVSFDL